MLERPVRIRFHKLAAADVAARARGVHVLTQAGVDRDRALAARRMGRMTSDHATIESTVSAPTVPESVDTHAMAMAREKALSKTTDRRHHHPSDCGRSGAVVRSRVLPRSERRRSHGRVRRLRHGPGAAGVGMPVAAERLRRRGLRRRGRRVGRCGRRLDHAIAGTQDAPGGACNGSRGGLVPRPVLAPAGGAAAGPDLAKLSGGASPCASRCGRETRHWTARRSTCRRRSSAAAPARCCYRGGR